MREKKLRIFEIFCQNMRLFLKGCPGCPGLLGNSTVELRIFKFFARVYFIVLDGESCTIYFNIELNVLTGEVLWGWEIRVRYGEELDFGEIYYFRKPQWESGG